MNQNSNQSTSSSSKLRIAGAIGGLLGGAAAFGVGKLIGFENFWLGLILLVVGIGLGGFLAQKVASP